jgi:hypothetical protein
MRSNARALPYSPIVPTETPTIPPFPVPPPVPPEATDDDAVGVVLVSVGAVPL